MLTRASSGWWVHLVPAATYLGVLRPKPFLPARVSPVHLLPSGSKAVCGHLPVPGISGALVSLGYPFSLPWVDDTVHVQTWALLMAGHSLPTILHACSHAARPKVFG